MAFARPTENTITIIDLQPGGPQLTIDTGIQGLRVTGSTIAVADFEKIVSWNLAAGSGGANIINSVLTTPFDPPPSRARRLLNVSISPDLSRVVTLAQATDRETYLKLHDALTGRCLAGTTVSDITISTDLRFTPDGRGIWGGLGREGFSDGWEITVDSESGATKLQPLGKTQCPTGKPTRLSRHGYEVKDDVWILSPTKKRLLWLPHRWRLGEWSRTWSGRFLVLGHRQLPEMVILEFFE